MIRITTIVKLMALALVGCHNLPSTLEETTGPSPSDLHVVVLGIAQDAGYPQAACQKACCQKHYDGHVPSKYVSCIGLVDTSSRRYWIFDATPDFKEQLHTLEDTYPEYSLAGIFLTHAHVGHYTGLMHLGREIMGADRIPVYAMPRLKSFLENNGPWSQLVELKNIDLIEIQSDSIINLNKSVSIIPIEVPHRDEFSETVGYKIIGSKKSLMFIPDIDKWNKWDRDIITEIRSVNHALLDGTFYENGEIPGRDMSLIPHPFIKESLELFNSLNKAEKEKIQFIHFNHTNPVIDSTSEAYRHVYSLGLSIAAEGMLFDL